MTKIADRNITRGNYSFRFTVSGTQPIMTGKAEQQDIAGHTVAAKVAES